MESQHMTQQVFSDYLSLAPATLSGIFNDRTRPTLNVVEAIKKKFPNISTDWLMFGKEPMYLPDAGDAGAAVGVSATAAGVAMAPSGGTAGGSAGIPMQEPMLDFGMQSSPPPQNGGQVMASFNGVRSTRPELMREDMKYFDKPRRHVTEIRVYYDDQTWESFLPSKK